jgi:hypothetical protein
LRRGKVRGHDEVQAGGEHVARWHTARKNVQRRNVAVTAALPPAWPGRASQRRRRGRRPPTLDSATAIGYRATPRRGNWVSASRGCPVSAGLLLLDLGSIARRE